MLFKGVFLIQLAIEFHNKIKNNVKNYMYKLCIQNCAKHFILKIERKYEIEDGMGLVAFDISVYIIYAFIIYTACLIYCLLKKKV